MPSLREKFKPAFCPFCGSKLANYEEKASAGSKMTQVVLDACADCEIKLEESSTLLDARRFAVKLWYLKLWGREMEIVAKDKVACGSGSH